MGLINRLKKYAQLVMLSHMLFSLPFAAVSIIWASRGLPQISVLAWAFVALFAGRNAANALNRIIDKKYDKKNNRLSNRLIPMNKISVLEAAILSVFLLGLFVFAAYMINPICLYLSPFGIFLFVTYSYTKRFTYLCHLYLGFTCGGAVVAAWIAATASIHYIPLVFAAAVMFWVAGFDIIYAMQDIAFDRENSLHSIPQRFGLKASRIIAMAFHAITMLCLLSLYFLLSLHYIYLIGLLVISLLIMLEHKIIHLGDAKAMNWASYHINQIVSVAFFVFAMSDFVLIGGATWTNISLP